MSAGGAAGIKPTTHSRLCFLLILHHLKDICRTQGPRHALLTLR